MTNDVDFITAPGQPRKVRVDGETFVSEAAYNELIKQHRALSDRVMVKQRTDASHGHYFATIRDLWETLPETLAGMPYAKSPEHFRKHALIVTGFCDTDVMDCEDHQVAVAAAPLIAKMARREHGYAIITVRETLINCTTPHSQSYDVMKKDKFEESKNKVLDWMHQILSGAQ